MTFGMPTLVELPTLDQNAALCAQLGLQFVELNMNLPEYADLARIPRSDLLAWQRQGVQFTLHLDERMDVCDFNPLVAEAYLRTVRNALDLAGDVGLPILNMHLNPGVYFTLPHGKVYLYDKHEAHYLSAMEKLRSLVDAHAPEGTLICVENTDGFTPTMHKGIDLLLQSPRFALTLDVGHMHCINDADAPFYAAREHRIAHMHLHDATRTPSKNHLPLGEGELDIAQKLALANEHNCRVVLETKTVQALKISTQYLLKA